MRALHKHPCSHNIANYMICKSLLALLVKKLELIDNLKNLEVRLLSIETFNIFFTLNFKTSYKLFKMHKKFTILKYS